MNPFWFLSLGVVADGEAVATASSSLVKNALEDICCTIALLVALENEPPTLVTPPTMAFFMLVMGLFMAEEPERSLVDVAG